MTRRKLLVILALALSCGLAGFGTAQDTKPADKPADKPAQSDTGSGAGGGQRRQRTPEEQMKRLTEELKLNDDQAGKLKPIFEEQRKAMAEMRKDTSLAQEDRRKKMRELREASDTKIKAILTSEQFEKYEKLRRGQGGGRRRQNAQ
ncbi:MAG TPA: hypothetical protein VHH73_03680 [Verrucomicrobiae bacterium]|nr:hypothetical protein [Verrucomicrobiae bacterium]